MVMNTRLQVEHPVTEEITGVDLVEWQLRVASGEPLPLRQEELSINGWAMEARLYAEDPAKGFLPATGDLGPHLRKPHHVRWDSGVEAGDTITAHYDPMIAKIIASGPDRATCIAELRYALESLVTWPLVNNGAFLHRLLGREEFAQGAIDTGFIGQHLDELATPTRPSQEIVDACATVVAVASGGDDLAWALMDTPLSQPVDPWRYLVGFRANASDVRKVRVRSGGETHVGTLNPQLGHVRHWSTPGGVVAQDQGETWQFTADELRGGSAAGISDGAIIAPMPGKVIALDVAEGQQVEAGQRLMVLEAMKMEHALTAPFAGTVSGLAVSAGAQVQVDQVLAKVEKAEA
jgi:3-methylcrotonyl-CoA carboxylase alpha subunit